MRNYREQVKPIIEDFVDLLYFSGQEGKRQPGHPIDTSNLETTIKHAMHEAAHAVVAHDLGIPLDLASIAKSQPNDSLGLAGRVEWELKDAGKLDILAAFLAPQAIPAISGEGMGHDEETIKRFGCTPQERKEAMKLAATVLNNRLQA